MHLENHFYGHANVLAESAGLVGVVPPFRAHVQHGWAPFSPVGHPERLVSTLTYAAWSAADAAKVRAVGGRKVEAVGAPFLHLRRLRGLDGPGAAPRPGDGSMIVYPSHGWEREHMEGNHDRYVAEISDRATGPTTVCLYWVEFQQLEIRRVYEQAGFRVISHGTRADPGFLWRQFDEVLRHDIVSSNHLSTALWYGGSLGRDITRFGPEFSIYGDEYRRIWADYQRTRWPVLDERVVAAGEARELADAELGAADLRVGDELRAVLAPLTTDEHPWRSRAVRASVWGEYTSRRAFAVARSRIRPGAIRARDLQVMAEHADPADPAGPADVVDPDG